MDIYVLDMEGTVEDINLNGGSDIEIKKAIDNLEEILGHIGLGAETSIQLVGESYITTAANANWYKEEYSFKFSKVSITEL